MDIILNDANITGTVSINGITQASIDNGGHQNIVLVGNTTITKLVPIDGAKIGLENLTDGAMIGVSATVGTPFTVTNEKAAAYRKYFYATANTQIVKADGNQLVCVTPTYTDNLEFKPNGKAYCVVCGVMEDWTVLTNSTKKLDITGETKVHFYLKDDVEYTDEYDSKNTTSLTGPIAATVSACLHLNGKTLSSTERATIFGSTGILNVLGSGTVRGGTYGSNHGSAVVVNSFSEGKINLYSGTYTDRETTQSNKYVVSINDVGGNIDIFKDAKIESVTRRAVNVGRCNIQNSVINITDAEIIGDIRIQSPLGNTEDKYKNSTFITAGQTEVTIHGAKITGTVSVDDYITPEEAAATIHPAHLNFTVNGATTITELVLLNKAELILGELAEGVQIAVAAVSGAATFQVTTEHSGKTIVNNSGTIGIKVAEVVEEETPEEETSGTEETV